MKIFLKMGSAISFGATRMLLHICFEFLSIELCLLEDGKGVDG